VDNEITVEAVDTLDEWVEGMEREFFVLLVNGVQVVVPPSDLAGYMLTEDTSMVGTVCLTKDQFNNLSEEDNL